MGSLPGKFVRRRDVWDVKTYLLEEKVEQLESEVIKMRSEIEGYHKSKSARPSTTTRSNERYSMCEPHSGKYFALKIQNYIRMNWDLKNILSG